MAPTKKSSTSKNAAASVPAVTEQVAAPEPVIENVIDNAVVDASVEAPAADGPVTEAAAIDANNVNDPQNVLALIQTTTERITNLQRSVLTETKELLAAIKTIQKVTLKLLKKKTPKSSNTATTGGAPRKPSGFAKPTVLSPAMSEFLGSDPETKLARTEVTRLITKYIKDNTCTAPRTRGPFCPMPSFSSSWTSTRTPL